MSEDRPAGRRRHRRVIALSDVDRRRLAAGELASESDALHTGDPRPAPHDEPGPATGPGPDTGPRPGEERLLGDVPPHWGRQ